MKHISFSKLRRMQAFTPLLVVGVLMVTGAVIYNLNALAASAGFAVNADKTAYSVGDTITVSIIENSGEQCANVVEADVTYPKAQLQYVSSDISGSKFESALPASSGNGLVSLQQYTARKECGKNIRTSGVSGEQLIGKITFIVIGSGSATVGFKESSTAISSSDNKTNVATGSTDKTFSLSGSITTTPPPAPTPAPRPAPRPASKPVTSITPVNTDVSIPVVNDGTVQVETPVDVNPLPIQPDGINRIEYYLNGRLKATVKSSPYTYRLPTNELLNGKYALTTKTYYANGQTKSVSQTVIVKNAFGLTQLKLRAKSLAWLIILLLIVVAAAVAAWIAHNRGSGPTSGVDYGSEVVNPTYGPNPTPVIKPTTGDYNQPVTTSQSLPSGATGGSRRPPTG